MKNNPIVSRLALAFALSLSAGSLVAMAGEASDTTEIEVVANGKSEKISIDGLKVGETRQQYSEAGTLVTATRTADSLVLDIGGEKTTVHMVEPSEISAEELDKLLATVDGADGGKRVVRFHHATDGKHAEGEAGHRRVFIVHADGDDGELRELEGDGAHVIVDKAGEGKQVIVKRRVVKADADSE